MTGHDITIYNKNDISISLGTASDFDYNLIYVNVFSVEPWIEAKTCFYNYNLEDKKAAEKLFDFLARLDQGLDFYTLAAYLEAMTHDTNGCYTIGSY